jgi:hypothetical protein
MWLDYLRGAELKDDRALSDGLKRELRDGFARAANIPEIVRPETADVRLDDLWESCHQEQAFPHLSSLIRFIEELRSDDLGRLRGPSHESSRTVLSTMHKVKGLEFDNVIILPSSMPFGTSGDTERDADAAEEARLLYVGMTRAKSYLAYFVGDREYSWARKPSSPYVGSNTDGRVLVGSMQDVSLGWAMQGNAFNRSPVECQKYIETEVGVDDDIILGGTGGGVGKAFFHRGAAGKLSQVGFLAKKHGSGDRNAAVLKVSAIVRFRPDESDDSIDESIRIRGWGYAVLVSGRLR